MQADQWVFGFHAVLGALEGGRPVDAVWLQRGRRDGRAEKIQAAAVARGVPITSVQRSRLDRLTGGAPHNGCAARTVSVSPVAMESFLRPDGEAGSVVVLDGVVDPHNVGAVLRTAAAFAVDGVVLAGPGAPPLSGAVAKAAVGSLGQVPVARENVAADALSQLQGAGYWVLGADAAGAAVGEVTPTDRWVLCMGSEERGLRAKTRAWVDEWVSVPMAAGVESLNVSVAAGILLYALTRVVRADGLCYRPFSNR